MQAVLKWTLCILLLILAVLLFRFFDKKLNDGKIVDKLIHGSDDISPKDAQPESERGKKGIG